MTAPTHDGLIAGRYQLVAPIGSGGTATVYRGLDTLLDREVAVKQLTLAPAADDDMHAEAVERTFRAARAAARIHHPGVAEIYDVVSGDESQYIVMQLIEGRPLAELIAEQGPLPPHRVAGIGRQVLAALVAGHVVGVLHRDLKPGNVMITPDGQAVLTDFGIAAMAGDPPPAADLWSLGVTLYAALCGQGPFDDRADAMATLFATASEDPPPLTGDGLLHDIVNALLCREPAGRPTFAEIARDLDVAVADTPAGAVPLPAADLDSSPAAEAPASFSFGRRPQPRAAQPGEPLPARSAFEPPAPRADAGRDESTAGTGTRAGTRPGAGHPDRLARASLILAVVAGLGVAASALAAYLPGTSHSAQTPAAPVVTSPGLASSSPALAGSPAPPPVGQQFRVATAANADGSPEVVTRAPGGALIASRFTNGSWSAWTTLPGGPAYTANPAVAIAKDGRLIVFARAKTGQVAEIWQTSPGSASWHGPVPLGTTITHSSPAVVAWPDGHLEVFALLSDAHIGYVSQSSTPGGGTWTGWTSLGGPVTGPPAIALDATGHPQVFTATAGHQLVHDYYLNGNWAGWAGSPGKPLYVGVPGIATNADGRLEVFARSTNGDLLHVWQLSRTGPSLGGPGRLVENGCSTDPAVLSGINGARGGRLEAFCMDSNFGTSVFHTVQLSPKAGTSWSAWQSLKGSASGAITAVQTPAVTAILARTPAGALAYATWTVQHGWSAWSMLPASP